MSAEEQEKGGLRPLGVRAEGADGNGTGISRSFDTLADDIHAWALGKGFYDRHHLALPEDPSEPRYAPARTIPNPSLPSEKLMLIVTEVAEAQEALRNGDRENEAEEVADILIRVLDYAAWRGISLDVEVAKKMEKNRVRPHLHGRAAF